MSTLIRKPSANMFVYIDNNILYRFIKTVAFTGETRKMTAPGSVLILNTESVKPVLNWSNCLFAEHTSGMLLFSWALMAVKPSSRLISHGLHCIRLTFFSPGCSGSPIDPLGCLELEAFFFQGRIKNKLFCVFFLLFFSFFLS